MIVDCMIDAGGALDNVVRFLPPPLPLPSPNTPRHVARGARDTCLVSVNPTCSVPHCGDVRSTTTAKYEMSTPLLHHRRLLLLFR